MNDLDKIENALANKRLDPTVFERCAQDLLGEDRPGLTPIPGGTDWGRDADVANARGGVPTRLLATSSRSLDGVRKNMLKGIKSMKTHGVAFERLILANPATLRTTERQKLAESARKAGAQLDPADIYDRNYFASRLRRDGYWRRELLGLSSEPITLSRVAPDLAESPWAFLPLVAREGDVLGLDGEDDVIVTGPPGVGKSRLAGELSGGFFVDADAAFDQVAGDLRWALPDAVIVDDAAERKDLLRRLLSLRRQEPDLFRYRLVVICWTDVVHDVQVVLPDARVHRVELIERGPLDQLLQAMGVTGQLARGEILDQAEGRPGWAIALADLLLRASDTTSLLNGRALLGQVDRYMRRAGIASDAMDVLAVIAALGGVSDSELPQLAAEADMSRSDAARIVRSAATSGLIDVHDGYEADRRAKRTYLVRPPMLANVLIAERAFGTLASTIDIESMADRWPTRIAQLASAAIEAALLGAARARGVAAALFDRAFNSDSVATDTRVALADRFARLDTQAGKQVVQVVRESFDHSVASGVADGWRIEPMVSLAALVAGRYHSDVAFELLFDTCTIDDRSTHAHPGHPLRQLADLVENFHPELPRRDTARYKIADAAKRWFDRDPDSRARQAVAADVVRIVLSLKLESNYADPGNPMIWRLVRTVVPAEEMRRVFRDLWPIIADMLDHGDARMAHAVIDTAGEWLSIGAGADALTARSHPADRVAAAREIAEALVRELDQRTDLSLGTRIHLQATAEWYGVSIQVDVPADLEVFFRPIERGSDWAQAEADLTADLRATGEAWATKNPAVTIRRLVEIQTELERANIRWPDRTWIVAAALATNVAEPLAWLDAAEEAGFMPAGSRFAVRALAIGDLTEDRTRELLDDSACRPQLLAELLTNPSPPAWGTRMAIEKLKPRDFQLVETLVIRDEIPTVRREQLLVDTVGPTRGMVALAFFSGSRRQDGWTLGDIEPAWLDAIVDLRAADTPGASDYDCQALFVYLARTHPAALATLVERTLADAGTEKYRSMPHGAWAVLNHLPNAQKLQLWRGFRDDSTARYLLSTHLAGSDVTWLEELLECDEITTEQVLGCFNGLGTEPPITELAKLLVPRGVEPARIARLRASGFWSGNDSDRYQSIADSFARLTNDEDPNVRAVATAGVDLFSAARDEAAAREHLERVRGER